MLRILVADDEMLERTAISTIINKSGLPVEIVGEASNGLEALEMAGQYRPDAMLVDINMPGMTGLELIRHINSLDLKIRFVAITAYDDFDYAQESVELGVVEYLLKPARGQDIIRVLGKLTAIAEEERARNLEEQRLRQQLEQMLPYIKASFMTDLTHSGADPQALEERAAFLGFRPVPSVAMVVDIDKFSELSEGMSETNRQLAKKSVYEAVNEAAGSAALLTLPLQQDRIVLLAGMAEGRPAELAKNDCLALAERIRLNVQAKTIYSCVVGVGRYCQDTVEIPFSFEDANNSISMSKVFLGGNRAVHSDDVTALLDNDGWLRFHEGERRLSERFEQGKREDIRLAMEELKALLDADFPHSPMLRIRLCEAVLRLCHTAEGAGVEQHKLAAITAGAMAALGSADEKSVKPLFYDYCRRLTDLVCDDYPTTSHLEILSKAAAYLNRNFNKDISLEDVAKLIPLNPYYFSRLFKREMGMNFIDYLTGIRIYEAKKMLIHTAMTVAEIAEAVGYRDANYFSRVFSRLVGMPPRDYRLSKSTE